MQEFSTQTQPVNTWNAIAATAVITAVIVGGVVYWMGDQQTQQLRGQVEQQQQTINNLQAKVKGTPPPLKTGESQTSLQPSDDKNLATIEGSLSFPSEFIPEDMKICAEDIGTGSRQLYCTSQHIADRRFGNGVGYRLRVPQGAYYVYATTNALRDYRAYYSEFVICGLEVSCPSHEPIGIKVTAGKTMSGVDPADWYKN